MSLNQKAFMTWIVETFRNNKRHLFRLAVIAAIAMLIWYFYSIDFFIYNISLINGLTALLVPLIAILSLYIAYQQARTSTAQKRIANNKLRLELFERRSAIYYATKELISKINAGNITVKQIIAYTDIVRDAKWFLTDGIHSYLNESIYNAAASLEEIDRNLENERNTDQRKQLVINRQRLRNWIAEQDAVIEKKFSKYLKFRLQK